MKVYYNNEKIAEVYADIEETIQSLKTAIDENGEPLYPDTDKFKIEYTKQELNEKISGYIYAYYSQKKQAQDEKWVSAYTTKLKAKGIKDLEKQIVVITGRFFDGESLKDILKDVPDEQKKYFEKLVKVAIRTEWAERCIIEGKLAIKENREPVYPDFPKIE